MVSEREIQKNIGWAVRTRNGKMLLRWTLIAKLNGVLLGKKKERMPDRTQAPNTLAWMEQ